LRLNFIHSGLPSEALYRLIANTIKNVQVNDGSPDDELGSKRTALEVLDGQFAWALDEARAKGEAP